MASNWNRDWKMRNLIAPLLTSGRTGMLLLVITYGQASEITSLPLREMPKSIDAIQIQDNRKWASQGPDQINPAMAQFNEAESVIAQDPGDQRARARIIMAYRLINADNLRLSF